MFLNYVQHIFPVVGKRILGGTYPPLVTDLHFNATSSVIKLHFLMVALKLRTSFLGEMILKRLRTAAKLTSLLLAMGRVKAEKYSV